MLQQQGPSAAARYARETVDLAMEGADANRRDDRAGRLRGARDPLSGSGLTGSVVEGAGWLPDDPRPLTRRRRFTATTASSWSRRRGGNGPQRPSHLPVPNGQCRNARHRGARCRDPDCRGSTAVPRPDGARRPVSGSSPVPALADLVNETDPHGLGLTTSVGTRRHGLEK
ncbi:hypothetical protein GCM10010472_34920 [Pseudonocardia halophobica]|uniref:Uncharacterized protein n=1 Tax=Pseudonocardia halophobica TaxID=29401 RepID=A0A9W6NX06_9PSEU|nr:hypothetical protein GCM10017577_32720 [Pseudonocardia halophobica]